MGGLGHGHVHSDAVQIATFIVSLFIPGSVFALLAGAFFEQLKRKRARPSPHAAHLATPLSARELRKAA